MAHSRPQQGLSNQGDEIRVLLAATEFVNPCLATDPRVRASYRAWGALQQVGPLVTYLQRHPRDVEAVQALGTVLGPNHDPVNRAWASRLVDELHTPFAWVGRVLVAQFGLWVVAEASGRPAEKVTFPPTAVSLPKGRLPRLNGRQITEGVRWYYRREVRDPVEELHVLVEEYVRATGRVTQAHSVVQNRITQARDLLGVLQLLDA